MPGYERVLSGRVAAARMRAERIVRRGLMAARHRLAVARFAAAGSPRLVNWDLTYACPMRCEHCYSSTEQIVGGRANDYLVKIEADGRMRAVDIYEGTVGNVLEEPFETLWARARERHTFQGHLAEVRSMVDWARATRAIDRRYAAPADLVRLQAR